MTIKIIIFNIFLFTSILCNAQDDVCKVSSIAKVEDLEKSLQCMKQYTSKMKQLLGEANNELKNHYDLMNQLLARESDCIIVEKTFQYKQRGLPYNKSITESQRLACERDSKDLAIQFSTIGKVHWKLVDSGKLTEDAIEAFEIKKREIDAIIGQTRIK